MSKIFAIFEWYAGVPQSENFIKMYRSIFVFREQMAIFSSFLTMKNVLARLESTQFFLVLGVLVTLVKVVSDGFRYCFLPPLYIHGS